VMNAGECPMSVCHRRYRPALLKRINAMDPALMRDRR
jgi:hypothetical protein